MKLYTYFRSSAAFRVRIALNLKGLTYDHLPISLRNGEQLTDTFKTINPLGLVPILEEEGNRIYQSLAICEYLEERFPLPSLLPVELAEKAWVRSLALTIGCEIHPLNNLRVLNFLKTEYQHTENEIQVWYKHWIEEGFTALETMLSTSQLTGKYCYKETPSLADLFLVPQVYNAIRYQVSLDAYPTIRRINDACLQLPAFEQALPKNQPDSI